MGQFRLHEAARRGQVEVLKMLINVVKIDAIQKYKELNVLQVATRHGQLNCVRYLIEEGNFYFQREKGN